MLNPSLHHAQPARTVQQVVLPTTQTVVIVNGSPEILALLETVLEAGHYNVVFVESNDHAYSQIKHVRPDLIILCVRIDENDGFQVLSMLKLDEDTRGIPVLTYATEYEGEGTEEEESSEPSNSEMFTLKHAQLMN
jgi:CheY-like chemotaxis protein